MRLAADRVAFDLPVRFSARFGVRLVAPKVARRCQTPVPRFRSVEMKGGIMRAPVGRSDWSDLAEWWDNHEIPMLRLAGNGGAALFLRAFVTPAPQAGPVAARLALDIGVMGPDFRQFVLGRTADAYFPAGLREFFLSAAAEQYPESSVSSLQDVSAGLSIAVVESDQSHVTLDVVVASDPEALVKDFFDLRFDVTRASLVTAAHVAGKLALFRPADSVFGAMRAGWPWFWGGGDDAELLVEPGEAPLLHNLFPFPEGSRMTGVWTNNPPSNSPNDIVLFAFVQLGYEQDPAGEGDFLSSHLPNCMGGMYGVYTDGAPWLAVILKGPGYLIHESQVAGHDVQAGGSDLIASSGEAALVGGLVRALHFNQDAALEYTEFGGPGIMRGQAEGGDCFWTLDDLRLAYTEREVPIELIGEWTVAELVWGLLAETCNVSLPQLAVGYATGCAFPGERHACEHDVFRDVFTVWRDGRLRESN